jgi:hypothetical protein
MICLEEGWKNFKFKYASILIDIAFVENKWVWVVV